MMNVKCRTERLVRGYYIFCQYFRKWQIGRLGLTSLPWQHYGGKFQNRASLLVKLCTCYKLAEAGFLGVWKRRSHGSF